MLTRGDDYYVAICNTSGVIAIYNESKNIFISPFSDGPLKFAENFENTMNLEVISKYGKSFSIVRVPYSFKLLMQELQVMNIQMRIITEDNIDQLTSMNYAKTIQNLKLTKLTKKEGEDYNKKYESISIRSRERPKTTKQIIEEEKEEGKPEMIDLAEKGPLEEKPRSTDEDDDNEGLSQVTIDSIKRAEDEFSKYQDIDDDENELIKIGDVVNSDELGIEDLNVEKSITPKEEQSNINSETEMNQNQKEPTLLENITSNTSSNVEKVNNEKSENMKTIVIKDQ
jgi:DNA-directed RNA polymerase II subunit RPB2